MSPDARPPAELTLRGIALGGVITLLFTAANVYLGLKVGLTFATSIPAAVIAMAVLRLVGGGSILENNIVQTIASAAGTLAAIIFVLPGLLLVGWWSGFPYWTTVGVCASGGILGVLFSVPLRRALVTTSDLPYPEGIAAAEVLKIGSGGAEDVESARGLRVLLLGSLVSAGYALLAAAKLVADAVSRNLRIGTSATGASTSFSMALIGVGHLVGLSVGAAMFVGMLVAWGVLIPVLTHGIPGDVDAVVDTAFHAKVRFVGAGTIGVAALWTLLRILGPVLGGIRAALAASRARGQGAVLPLVERDLPIGAVALGVLATLPLIALLLWHFAAGGPITADAGVVIAGTLLYILVMGVVIASVCGYMAGLIGASNSPVSGVGILAVLAAALLLGALYGHGGDPARTNALIAYALFATAIVFSVATISNDNLQDLKTGQLVGATPWKQQVALVIGVVFGSLTIPYVLNLLQHAFGFQGMAGAGPAALAAPQAALISALAKGVLGGDLDWGLIGVGGAIGVAAIGVDEALGRWSGRRLPPLALGMGIYLPMALTLLIPVGAVIGHLYDRWAARARAPELALRLGVLAATGLIVGESLFGVVFAGIVGASGNSGVLAVVGPGFARDAAIAAPILFAGAITWLYARTRALAR